SLDDMITERKEDSSKNTYSKLSRRDLEFSSVVIAMNSSNSAKISFLRRVPLLEWRSLLPSSKRAVDIKDHSFSSNSKIELFLFNSNNCISNVKKGSSQDEGNFAIFFHFKNNKIGQKGSLSSSSLSKLIGFSLNKTTSKPNRPPSILNEENSTSCGIENFLGYLAETMIEDFNNIAFEQIVTMAVFEHSFVLNRYSSFGRHLEEIHMTWAVGIKGLHEVTNAQTGLGYDSQEFDSPVLENQVNEKYNTCEGYHAVPPLYTGNYMPPKPNLVFVDEHIVNESITSLTDWVSDSEDENEIETKSNQIKPSFAKVKFVKTTEHVKSPRKSDKQKENNRQTKYLRKNSQGPRGNVIDHIFKDSGSYMLKRFNYVDLQGRLKSDQGIFDSGCTRHVTGNKSFLTDYQDIDGGFVAFRGSPKGALDYLISEDMFDD
nr:hypothetical protein [Tanacetum cinerariifolium]